MIYNFKNDTLFFNRYLGTLKKQLITVTQALQARLL